MTSFDTVEVPIWDRSEGPQLTLRQIDRYCASPPVLALARAFGASVDKWSQSSLVDDVAAFASTTWDFRSGQERDVASRVTFDDDQESLILDAAEALGLRVSAPPSRRDYDSIIALGGLVRACVVRPRFARQLVDQGTRAREFVALGARRSFSDNELAIAAELGLESQDEFDALEEGIRLAFRDLLNEPPDRNVHPGTSVADTAETTSWTVSATGAAGLLTVAVVAAPTTRPGAARANTSEAYEYWIAQHSGAISSVLAVTNSIYVPYQGCVAIRALGLKHGISVETIGVANSAADLGALTQPFGAQDYLQELNAALNEMARLRRELMDTEAT